MNRRKDMVGNLRSKANQVASALNMSNFANRDSLLGPETKPDDAMNRVSGMDNQGIVGFQRQVMRGKLPLLRPIVIIFGFCIINSRV